MSAFFQFDQGSRRNTKCYEARVGGVILYISYQTVVGIDAGFECRYRRKNTWGPTTGKHLKEMGCYDYAQIDDAEEFDQIVKRALIDAIMTEAKNVVLRGEMPSV